MIVHAVVAHLPSGPYCSYKRVRLVLRFTGSNTLSVGIVRIYYVYEVSCHIIPVGWVVH